MQLYEQNSVASIVSKAKEITDVLSQPLISTLQRQAPHIVADFLDEFTDAVTDMQDLMQVPKHSRAQLMLIAEDFVEKYSSESLADIMLMLKFARRGDYGTGYARINPETLHKWMSLYVVQKAETYQRRHRVTMQAEKKIEEPQNPRHAEEMAKLRAQFKNSAEKRAAEKREADTNAAMKSWNGWLKLQTVVMAESTIGQLFEMMLKLKNEIAMQIPESAAIEQYNELLNLANTEATNKLKTYSDKQILGFINLAESNEPTPINLLKIEVYNNELANRI